MSEFNADKPNPYQNYRFHIKMDGRYVAGISEVSSLNHTDANVTFREGGNPSVVRLAPGQTKYEPITLERGITQDPDFEQWANKVWDYPNADHSVSLTDFRKDITIELYNEAGQKVMAYNVYRCWPSEYTAMPELDGTGNAVAIQTLVLQNEGCERQDIS